jgi:alpha-N-arabinofuranosidase
MLAAGALAQSAPARLAIQTQTPVAKVSPTLYGLMTEEINYSYDGGLYAELVRNRGMHDYGWEPSFWFVAQNRAGGTTVAMDASTGPSTALPMSLKLSVKQASAEDPAGVENGGYWGVPVLANTQYKGSFFAKAADASIGAVTVNLVNDDSGKVVASATVPALSAEWKQYRFTLQTGELKPSAANHLVLTVAHPGTAWFSLVSLFPPTYKNRENGFRIDLMEKMAAMHPKFLRFPGGNYLEGNHIAERFDWKKTIGPWSERPMHWSPWGYLSSDGMGLQEFLDWCEDLHMMPVLAVYAGYSLQQEHVDAGPKLEPYVQDALDEIEYVTGSADTKWGAIRAKNGHPEPYQLTYVEIGNEDNFDNSKSYDARYAQFYKAIKQKYPQLQLIATTPVNGMTPDVVDDHYYRTQEAFLDDTHHYDKADRKGAKIFVGEWATMEGSPSPYFGPALSDAAWMTGMERNSDLIVMASYAPMLVNVNPGAMQWRTNLIGYDALQSYGSPSYYAQVLFGSYVGQEVLDSSVTNAGPRFYYSVTRDAAKGKIYLKLVNATTAEQPLEIDLAGAHNVGATAELHTLQAATRDATNTIDHPKNIVPVSSRISVSGANFRHTVPALAIQVLELDAK